MPGMGNLARVLPERPEGYHLLGRGDGFTARDCVCRDARNRGTFEGSYPQARIAVMLRGTFHARSSQGTAVLHPGAMLLGNRARAYAYRHLDDGEDRAIVFDYDEAMVAEIGGGAF